MLYSQTPIGKIKIPSWEENKVINLTDEQLLDRAIAENNKICISPATYAMIEKRFLGRELQRRVNAKVGMRHDTLRYLDNL